MIYLSANQNAKFQKWRISQHKNIKKSNSLLNGINPHWHCVSVCVCVCLCLCVLDIVFLRVQYLLWCGRHHKYYYFVFSRTNQIPEPFTAFPFSGKKINIFKRNLVIFQSFCTLFKLNAHDEIDNKIMCYLRIKWYSFCVFLTIVLPVMRLEILVLGVCLFLWFPQSSDQISLFVELVFRLQKKIKTQLSRN